MPEDDYILVSLKHQDRSKLIPLTRSSATRGAKREGWDWCIVNKRDEQDAPPQMPALSPMADPDPPLAPSSILLNPFIEHETRASQRARHHHRGNAPHEFHQHYGMVEMSHNPPRPRKAHVKHARFAI